MVARSSVPFQHLPRWPFVPSSNSPNQMGVPNPSQLHYVEVMSESVLQGMYTVLILVVIWLLQRSRNMPMIHKVMFIAGIVMWMLACVHLGLVIQQVTHVVTPIPNAQSQASIATIQFMIGDMIIIWRVWAVWGRSYLAAALPFVLMLTSAALRFVEVSQIKSFVNRPRIADVSIALLVTNVILSTLLIAGRIWYMQWNMNKVLGRAPSGKSQRTYRGIILVIIESGSLYAITQIIDLILDDLHNVGIHTVLDIQIPLAGMLPTLIVLVVHLDLVPGSADRDTYNSTVGSMRFQAATNPGQIGSSTFGGSGGTKGTEVSLQRTAGSGDIDAFKIRPSV